ncbi:MAG: UDP-N-acetylmuramoyl-tripeptide--D-alanyl-D-alanine ligase [bacterium]|nr:UDP-N-acetylmuramoyl-tripeptide--D-alanyl-D-alanine ligase [bacterium]
MEPLKIDEILLSTGGELLAGDKAQWICGISTDSRQIAQGQMFIALKGDKFDGHDFIDEVIKKGVSALIISSNFQFPISNFQFPISIIKVKNTLIALGKIAADYRQKFQIPIVAITGSNGKTTTKEMAGTLLSKKFNTLKSKSSFNNAIGLPLTLLELNNTTQAAVVEIGMNHVGEIKYLAQIAKPTIALITNVGESHLEYLNSRANIAKEKAQLLEAMDGIAILNRDDYYSNRIKFKGKKITFGIHHQADITASDITQDINGISFKMNYRTYKTYSVTMPILGLHNVYNVLGATAIACAASVEWELIKDAYQELKTPYGRMGLHSYGDVRIINDAYNANPTSMKAALETLKQIQTRGRKIFVMGDMLELRHFTKSFHQTVVKKAIESGVNILFTIGKESARAAKDAGQQGVTVYQCETNEEIITKLKKILAPQDIILIKGSRRMRLEEVVEGLK